MKININSSGIKINKLKNNIEYKFDKNQEDIRYKKQINEVLEAYVEDEFEYAKIIVSIKDIYSKYFDEKSEKNIINENMYNFENKEFNESKSVFKSNGEINYKYLFEMDDLDMESVTSEKKQVSSQELTINMKEFIDEYNSLIEKIKVMLSESKSSKSLKIKSVEEKDKQYEILKLKYNTKEKEKKINQFIAEIRSEVIDVINEMGAKVNAIGINSFSGSQELKLSIDENKYKKSIEKDASGVYFTLLGVKDKGMSPIKKAGDIFKKYSTMFDSIFINGLKSTKFKEKAMSVDEIKKQEDEIRRLMDRMNKKENELSSRFNMLKFDLEQCDKQNESFA